MQDENDKELLAERASEAAFELEISRDTRSFLKNLSIEKPKLNNRRFFYFSGVAASLLILIVSIVTINLSHSDYSIADEFGINKQIARNGNNISNDNFTKAVRAYYSGNFTEATSWLEKTEGSEDKISEYKDWLRLLIELRTSGSKSVSFNEDLDAILQNGQHEFHHQAVMMKEDLNLFWRAFILK